MTKNEVRPNSYYDSATLMLITNTMAEDLGAKNVAVMMGTKMNKDLLREFGLLTEDGEAAGSNDLIIAAKGEEEAAVDAAIERAKEALQRPISRGEGPELSTVRTLDTALKEMPDASLVLVSVPGQYARGEVMKALDQGLHVMLFSDNVPLEHEIELKDHALSEGLLMMGPDCGTAVINGTPLAFANTVDRGSIGILAASGTGLQETSVLISRNGGGITQGIGTGGRDVKDEVGGRMMLAGLDALSEDQATKVILVVAKPPDPGVVDKLAERIRSMEKPVVTCFLGDPASIPEIVGAVTTHTLEDAAFEALAIAEGHDRFRVEAGRQEREATKLLERERNGLSETQRYIRGLYTGGTLCYEAILISRTQLEEIYSNTPVSPDEALSDSTAPRGHTFLDLGEDEFTRGRPHPMIEPGLRNQWMVDQARDPEVAVLLIDVVIGFGSHEDPAGVAAEGIREAKETADSEGRHLSVVASVCGTEGDYQGLRKQRKALEDAGAVVLSSNAQAARFAVSVVGGRAAGRGEEE
jgi:succinyl-CoA synthetase alpha subunit